jgi:hypothetical protein
MWKALRIEVAAENAGVPETAAVTPAGQWATSPSTFTAGSSFRKRIAS